MMFRSRFFVTFCVALIVTVLLLTGCGEKAGTATGTEETSKNPNTGESKPAEVTESDGQNKPSSDPETNSNSSLNDEALPKTVIKFDTTFYDFGKKKLDDKNVSYKYTFTNIGKHPLKITKVQPSCGCTTSDYTKDLVPPGAKGFVTLKFDPLGKTGENNKHALIYSNGSDKPIKLKYHVVVEN